jgi:hypothetical protein
MIGRRNNGIIISREAAANHPAEKPLRIIQHHCANTRVTIARQQRTSSMAANAHALAGQDIGKPCIRRPE